MGCKEGQAVTRSRTRPVHLRNHECTRAHCASLLHPCRPGRVHPPAHLQQCQQHMCINAQLCRAHGSMSARLHGTRLVWQSSGSSSSRQRRTMPPHTPRTPNVLRQGSDGRRAGGMADGLARACHRVTAVEHLLLHLTTMPCHSVADSTYLSCAPWACITATVRRAA